MVKTPEPSIETLEMKRQRAERAAAKRLQSKRMNSQLKRMKEVDLD